MDNALGVFERLESEVRGYIRAFPTVFTHARGALLYDEAGREYIDFFSGASALNYGHNHPQLKEKLVAYLHDDGLVHSLDMATSAKRRFLEVFDALILKPRGLPYKVQFTGPTGSDAVEAALKIARNATGRSTIIAFTNSFHGMTLGALAATGPRHNRQAAGVPLHGTTFMPYDDYLGEHVDTLDYFRRVLTDASSGVDLPAAVIVETIQGEGGVNVASTAWLRGLEALCRTFDILLIVDDIQAGCGRSGSFFSFDGMGLSPDIVTLSKSLSGYGLPMAMVLMKPDLDRWRPGEHTATFRGNNLAFVAAAATLELFWHDEAFARDMERKSQLLRHSLEAICRRYPAAQATVRGRGLLYGLACDVPGLAQKITQAAFHKGLVIETSGAANQVVKCLPPLVIDAALLEAGLARLNQSVAAAVSAHFTNLEESCRPLWASATCSGPPAPGERGDHVAAAAQL